MAQLLGMTIAINAGDIDDVLDFYTRVFGRGPDTAPMDDFLEWQICPGTWLQLSTGHDRPGANNARMRFEVRDIDEAVGRMAQAQVPIGEIVRVPEVVAFANFSDNWGNALGFYQLLSARQLTTAEERRLQEAEHAARQAARDSADQQTEAAEIIDERAAKLPPIPADGSVPGQTGPTRAG
ncbi:putative enzyme related to lactoylglutathione lyase [Kineosphaera limosa]|uniref:Glyoxalase/fosfomycin resistance/dioxygenase domain-containing protein n=1 Tax=Kineosphaera limosa NBRC 100340 TaxID=1184609 RepID=K6WXU1_9MICO|nr:VOC family protein [Kineosphaera limosa]NYE00270.1 putative enzyme related to lactoylglutathione lyase [Kineosphaera limosa]GAB96902.1 hypothetical protein KILIM_051_00450 [Kineosphaera limosa NBRC 100340]